jgi:Cdc6-like AAA superfamily ATPase
MFKKNGSNIIAAGLLGTVAAFSVPIVIDRYDQREINLAFIGNKKEKTITNFFPREIIYQSISKFVFDPNGMYFMVIGQHGVGKSSILKKIAEDNTGIIYVKCPQEPKHFGQKFADAICYSTIYRPHILRKLFQSFYILPSSKNFKDIMPEFYASELKFLHAVKNYKNKTGKIPVLVIDQVNNLLRTDEGKYFLLQLQDFAKSCAVC